MNTKTSLKLALGTTFAAGIALSSAQVSAENPFSAAKLDSGYMQLAENTATDAKPAEGKCGGDKGEKEGKCGEGKCGGAKGGDMECPADADKDGMVTKEEFVAHHEKMFEEADTNKDGSLDADERKALHSKNMEGKCGGDKATKEGKCGEGKCGGDKGTKEGKCGEGKCGGDKG